MRFIETAVFTDTVAKTLCDDELRSLQTAFMLRPALGPVISWQRPAPKDAVGRERPRKARRSSRYLLLGRATRHDLLLIYRKGDQDDLTPRQLKVLSRLVREELK